MTKEQIEQVAEALCDHDNGPGYFLSVSENTYDDLRGTYRRRAGVVGTIVEKIVRTDVHQELVKLMKPILAEQARATTVREFPHANDFRDVIRALKRKMKLG